MAGISGQPSPKPSSLDNPVPNEAAESEFDSFLNSLDVPETPSLQGSTEPAPTTESAVPTAGGDTEFGQFMSGVGGVEPSLGGESPLSDPRGIESIKEQLREAGARLKNAFAVTDVESLDILRNSGLFEDVRKGQDGTLEVKRPGRQGFEKFDRDKLEIIGDTIDFARDAFEMVIEGGTEAAGTIGLGAAGAAVGGLPGAVMSGAAGNVAAGAAGAVTAKNAGDFVAEQILDIPIDPGRDKASENKVAAAFGAGFGWLGSQAARRAAKAAFTAKQATTKMERVASKVSEARELVNTVAESGIKLDGNKFKLDVQQAVGKGQLPEAETAIQKLLTEDGFQNFRANQGEALTEAIDSVSTHLGSQVRGREVGEDFVLSAMDIKRAEGKLIGDYRKFAKQELTEKPLQAPRTAEYLQNAVNDPQLRVNPKTGRMEFDPNEAITDLSDSQQKAYVNFLNKAMVPLRKNGGGMNIDAAQDLYTQLSKEINRNIGSDRGRAYAYRLIDLKNSVRDDWTDMIGEVLPKEMMEEYATSKAAYADIMKSFDALSSELKTTDISAEALSNAIFSKGKQGLQKARAAKALFMERDPRMWRELTSQYMNTMFNNAWDGADGVYNFKKMMGDWAKLGPQMQMEILNGSGIKPEGLNALFKLGAKYQKANTTFKADTKDIKNLTQLALAVFGRVSDIAREQIFSRMLGGVGKDQMLINWLQDGGVSIIEKELRGKMKPSMIKKFTNTVMKLGSAPPARTIMRRDAQDEKTND